MDLNVVKVYIFGKFNYFCTKCIACQWELTFLRADISERKRPLAQAYQPSVISLLSSIIPTYHFNVPYALWSGTLPQQSGQVSVCNKNITYMLRVSFSKYLKCAKVHNNSISQHIDALVIETNDDILFSKTTLF